MSFESSGYRENRILPENVENDLKSWANSTTGWLMMSVALFGWASLLSWSSQDMHLGMATRDLRNLFGPPGAVFSDFFMSGLGLGSMFLFLPLAIWGFKIKNGLAIQNFKQRLALLPVSVLLLAGALGVIPTSASWPMTHGYGGIFGDLVFGFTTNFIGSFKPAFADFLTIVILGSTGLTTFLSTIELRFSDISDAFKFDQVKTSLAQRVVRLPGQVMSAIVSTAAVMLKILSDTFKRKPKEAVYAPEPVYAPVVKAAYEPEPEQHMETSISVPSFAEQAGEEIPFSNEMRDDNIETYNARSEMTGELPPIDPWTQDEVPGFEEAEAGRRIAERFAPRSARKKPAPTTPASSPSSPTQRQNTTPTGNGFFARRGAASQPTSAVPVPSSTQTAPKTVRQAAMARTQSQPARRAQKFQRPPLEILKAPGKSQPRADLSESVLRGNAGLLADVLEDFGVLGKIIDIKPGPVVTLYEFEPARGVKSSRVIALADDIARSMSAVSARVAVVPGRNVIGIELPNMRRDVVYLSELFCADAYAKTDCALPLALGKNIAGAPVVVDLARMPHLLIAGTTGSGKSVGINAMILSLLYGLSPDQCKFIMIDPKMLELSVYNDIPHLLAPVVTDPQKAVGTLNWVVREMEERYKNMSLIGVRNIGAYNDAAEAARSKGRMITRQIQTGYHPETRQPIYEERSIEPEVLPFIVVVIDELADLMMVAGKEIEGTLQRLAQMARAAGIHLIMATQRPSVDVVTGTIKSNFPTRISFKVASKIDSRTILAESGAEQLLGHGDMLYSTGPGQMSRIHGPLVEDREVEKIVEFLKAQGQPNYVEALASPSSPQDPAQANGSGSSNDELFERAVAIVVNDQKVSTSYIQRRLSIGYNRAADLIDRMEGDGLISAPNRTGKRQILMGESDNIA